MLFTAVQLNGSSLPTTTTVGLQYFLHGPTLNIECYKFLPTHQNQTRDLKQNSSGWHYVETTAYCMKNVKVNILSYIQGCVESALREAYASKRPVAFFFQLALLYKDVSKLFGLYFTS